MFRLHDRTRRWICIALFFALCAMPTAAALGWAAARHWPGRAGAEAERLGEMLGLRVSLEGVEHPRPGVTVYTGLQLADPETGKALLRCRRLEARSTDVPAAEGGRKPALVLLAEGSQVDAAGLGRLWPLVERTMRRERSGGQSDVRFSATRAALLTPGMSYTLTELEGGIEILPGGAQSQAGFRVAGHETPQPARVRLVRNQQTSPPQGGFELDTGGGPLPCGLLALGLPALEPLGPDCRFQGYVWASRRLEGRDAAGWEGEITGQLLDVDLDRLVTANFPHRLSGTAEVSIHSGRFRGGRIEQASGSVTAGPGVISRSLVEAATEKLSLAAGVSLPSGVDAVDYQQLALAATLDAGGLQIEGRCAVGVPGVVLAGRNNWMLAESGSRGVRPVAAVIQTLVPSGAVQVPATPQSARLARCLPLPQAPSTASGTPGGPRSSVMSAGAASQAARYGQPAGQPR